jgi:hypothetical protein
MKTKLRFISVVLMLAGFSVLHAQGFQPPSAGKAVVYFVRVSSYGYAVAFDFFNNDKYIGAFKGVNYMRYECDPGQQLLWASSENKDFVSGELKEGGSYIVIVDIIMGAMKAHVGLTPISASDKDFERCKKLIDKEQPVEIDAEKVAEKDKKLEKFKTKELNHYNEVKATKNFKTITAEMAIPTDLMK